MYENVAPHAKIPPIFPIAKYSESVPVGSAIDKNPTLRLKAKAGWSYLAQM